MLPALALISAMCPASLSAVTTQTAPVRQKVTEAEIDRRFALARSLAEAGKFEQSLKEYLFVFDNSRGVGGYGGVRLSYVPGEIAAIGQSYPPALAALRARRDESEKLLLAARADFTDLQELTSLNEYLGTPERNLATFDKLKGLGASHAEVREDMITLVWEQLVAAKRYGDLKSSADELARRVVSRVAETVINNDFPGGRASGAWNTPEYQSYLRFSIIEEGGRVYEVFLGLGRADTAEKLAKWMLTFSADGEVYARLINSAINAERGDVAGELIERANKLLKRGEDLRLVREAAERLAGAKAN
jgi:hypothetical protein